VSEIIRQSFFDNLLFPKISSVQIRAMRQNQRIIGTLRRECLDHVLIFGEQHLRRVLTLYALYYNETRTHLGLAKDAPRRRAVQRYGTIVTTPILCGLHHRYARI
jgi:hypothetical protein